MLAAFISWQRWTLRRRSTSAVLSAKELSTTAEKDVHTALENLLMFEEQFTSAGDPGSAAEAQVYDPGASHQTAHTIALLRAHEARVEPLSWAYGTEAFGRFWLEFFDGGVQRTTAGLVK
ncbi:hypothetical protein AAFM46_02455 [Arthrobacter sp. TMP15]|uniref:hypothetical protein n=1 Tax=Arthrobacter sp. TMP15 TaxID=3140789 RepID=UPI0031B9C85D